jgi:methylphosphotriester-DNA--protein-cysteine methyltransferase
LQILTNRDDYPCSLPHLRITSIKGNNDLIEKAKEKISTTNLTISEIAYELGFEHPSSFNKLFKSKTDLSPLEFRRSFN